MTELSPFNRMELYSSNRREGFQPLTGFTPQQDDQTFTIDHSPNLTIWDPILYMGKQIAPFVKTKDRPMFI